MTEKKSNFSQLQNEEKASKLNTVELHYLLDKG
jgi:hypothetical protein